jgi:ABC-type Fe3+ transport system substrate-binding protein
MSDVLVYTTESRADAARVLLGAACAATATAARVELFGSGSLYQRLGMRRGPPFPDVVLWFGPYAAQAAGLDGLLQPYTPPRLADRAAHDPDWKWTTLDHAPIGVAGSPAVPSWQDLVAVPRLALADPERSEAGMSLLLATLDRARQVDGDVERGWIWWQHRAQTGLLLAEDDATAAALVEAGSASHALTLAGSAARMPGLAPLPHAIGMATSSRNTDAARRLLDWLTSEAAGATLPLSPWQASTNGLAGLLAGAPPLDIDWARQHYTAVRQRWAQSGFGPTLQASTSLA